MVLELDARPHLAECGCGRRHHYHWFSLRAAGDQLRREVLRCVGTLVDITEQKKAEERLLHDAVHDNLTGLPNRELFMNRLEGMIALAKAEEKFKPTVFIVDVDRFKQVNDGLGISAGDTILLTIARRLHRILKPRDALSRFAGDHFALMLLSEQDPARIARSPMQAIRRRSLCRARSVSMSAVGAHHLDLGAKATARTWSERRARHAPGQALRRRPHQLSSRRSLGRHRPAAAGIDLPCPRAQGPTSPTADRASRDRTIAGFQAL